MNSWYYIWFMLVKVILFFTLVYIVIPAQFIHYKEQARSLLDKLFISLTHSTLFVIIITHLLVFAKIYETISLVLFSIAAYFLLQWLRGYPPGITINALKTKYIIGALDWLDGVLKLAEMKQNLLKTLNNQKFRARQWISLAVSNPFYGFLPVLVILAAAYIRFKHALTHAAFAHIDSYVHFYWAKTFGNNQIFHDGIYPMGYHAVISALAKLTLIDPYWLVRFIGPIGGLLMVLSVYYFACKITESHLAGFIALVVAGLVTNGNFPAIVFRQTTALSQEYAAIFILPGLYFLWVYLKSRDSVFLWLYAEALAITGLMHSYAAVYLTLCAIIMMFSALIYRILNLQVTISVVKYSFISGVVAMLPLGLGVLMGKEFHKSSAQFIQENVSGGQAISEPINILSKLVTSNPFLDGALVIILCLIISLIFFRDREWAIKSLTISGCSLSLYLLFRARELNLPELSDPSRTTVFLALLLAVLYSSGFNLLEKVVERFSGADLSVWPRRLWKAVTLTICLVIIYIYPPEELFKGVEEYDAAAENYLQIKNDFTILDWTIVGPQEQFYQVVGSGWHIQILRFIQQYSLEQARDPQFKLPIPTHHVFFYTEKRPLNWGMEVTAADAAKDLEPEGEDPFMQYYRNKDQRAILEAKAIRWIETYRESHQGVSVFYEDANLKIYHLQHEPQKIQGEKG